MTDDPIRDHIDWETRAREEQLRYARLQQAAQRLCTTVEATLDGCRRAEGLGMMPVLYSNSWRAGQLRAIIAEIRKS